MSRYEAEQLLLAVLLSIGGLYVGASILLGGLIWRPSGWRS